VVKRSRNFKVMTFSYLQRYCNVNNFNLQTTMYSINRV
jgi:hypothetical protein